MLPRQTEKVIRSLKKLKVKHWVLIIIVSGFLLEYFGVFRQLNERSYEKEFSYPIEGDISRYVDEMKRGDTPSLEPFMNHNYYILKNPREKCLSEDLEHYDDIRVLYLVKSSANHFKQRQTIRETWGFQNRFADVPIRTVFLLGQVKDDLYLQGSIENEFQQHKDILQGDFIDTYFNNTIKTAMGLSWAYQQCPRSRFYLFVDDDYYVSTRNLLRFLRNPVNYPGYLNEDVISFDDTQQKVSQRRLHQETNADESINVFKSRNLQQLVDFDLPKDVRLFAGYMLESARPLRHRSSKWFVSLEEYPFDRWPPYVTAGSYVLSRAGLMDMYYTSYFTKLFRFDDIWLALIAKKANLEPFHCPEFHFYRKPYTVRGYKYVISSHGYSDPEELSRIWNEQKEAGNA